MKHKIAMVSASEDRFPEGIISSIRAFADIRCKKCESPDELLSEFPDAEIFWMFGPNVALKTEALEKIPTLKALLRSGSGLDALPCQWAKSRGVGVYNTPESIAESVAEHTVALLVSFVRQIPQYNCRAKAGYEWGKVEGMNWHLTGRTLGLIGYGNIARRVEKMLSGFDLKVMHYDPYSPGSTDVETLLKESDFVSVHCPLTPETEGLIDSKRLSLMKRGAILINTSRGPVLDEEAVADCLDSGHLGGVAIDVMCEEPPKVNSRLLNHPGAIVTPHVAAFSADFEKNFWKYSVLKLKEICENLDRNQSFK